tara:strand:+ start:322 stop:612 length:291 start_codon:yes stop_codon:yes gene_type:complete
MNFTEYYNHYLNLHQSKACRRMHVLGQVVTIAFTVFVLTNWHWYLIPLIPFIVYPFAWSGHYFFENNTPAAFKNPLWAKACDWLMLRDWILGRVER